MKPRPGRLLFHHETWPCGCSAAAICLPNANSQRSGPSSQPRAQVCLPQSLACGSTGPSAWVPDIVEVREVLPHVILCLSEAP